MTNTLCVVCSSTDESQAVPNWLVCLRCSNRALRWLRELEEYLPTLSLLKGAAGGEFVSGPGFGSKSPANDAVIHHTDWRSNWDDLDGHSALGVIGSWAAMVREERGLATPAQPTLFTEVGALHSNHPWVMQQPWADEYIAELRGVHMAVRALANNPVPRSVGKCINTIGNGECGGPVYEKPEKEAVQCSKCHRIYLGTDLIRLRMSWETA